jgi:two-component system response regulator HydG
MFLLLQRIGVFSMPSEQPASLQVGRRVLVIDDQDSFCRLMARLVTSFGYQVKTSYRLDPADIADLDESDFIFVDMMMPHTDGIQVLDILSRKQVRSSIVLMSGTHKEVLTTAETIANQSGLRVVAILNKPFRGSDIRRILKIEQQNRDASDSRSPQKST